MSSIHRQNRFSGRYEVRREFETGWILLSIARQCHARTSLCKSAVPELVLCPSH